MKLHLDEDVEKVINFMQSNVRAAKLVAVADSVKMLAKPLWGHFSGEDIRPISLRNSPISVGDLQK